MGISLADKVFVDTSFVLALYNKNDSYHERAKALFPSLVNRNEVWLTEAILVEIGNAFSDQNRDAAVNFIQSCYAAPNMIVVEVSSQLLQRAITLYRDRSDKEWGLTDCISFVVMQDNDLSDALTADRHFRQAGFRAVMLDD